MSRKLKIYFTSDTHGYLSSMDYATGKTADTGVANCAENFVQDGNTLIIDGGDTIQGSPFTYFLHKNGRWQEAIPARVMNACGYQYVTLGNHDFNYGQEELGAYLGNLKAKCLCANVEGLPNVEKTAVHVMANGLRVGITGITTCFIPVWEKPENLEGITITDPAEALQKALAKLKEENVDLTVCIYHGGFENDLETGASLSDTRENQAYAMCRDLAPDILLTGHQHIPMPGTKVFDTYTCQTADKGRHYAKMEVTVGEAVQEGRNHVASGAVTACSDLYPAGAKTKPEVQAILEQAETDTAEWLDTPKGRLDTALMPKSHIEMAAEGSLIANFFNQVQLHASHADLSCTSLGNEVKGFDQEVTIRDVVATYIYPNTMKTLKVNRSVLKACLERCAEYFAYGDDGALCVSDTYLKPKEEHYNYDYFSGIEVTMDITRPIGNRVVSILYQGEELSEDRELTLCMNNYRATGTGGYDVLKECEVVNEQLTEIVELIMDYISEHPQIAVDQTKWLHVIH